MSYVYLNARNLHENVKICKLLVKVTPGVCIS